MSTTPHVNVSWLGLLGVAFVVLKLCHVVAWPWWLVLCPFWIAPAILLGVFLAVFVVALACMALGARPRRRRWGGPWGSGDPL